MNNLVLDAVMYSIAIYGTLFSLLFFAIAIRQRELLDRYRLKYGFNDELELKVIDGNDITEKQRQKKLKKLEQRRKYFKKRTFTD